MKPTQVSRTPPPSAGRELLASSLWGREVQEHPQRLSQTSLCAPGLGAWDSRTLSFLRGLRARGRVLLFVSVASRPPPPPSGPGT